MKGRRVQGKLVCYQVRVGGMDNVERFAAAVPMWGPKGLHLTAELANPALKRHRGSAAGYLPASATEPVLAYLERRGVTAEVASALIGHVGGKPRVG